MSSALGAIPLVAIGSALLLAAVAHAAPVFDQQQTSILNVSGGATVGGPSHQKVAQVVRSGMSGVLAGVDLPVECLGDATLTVEIRGVTGATGPFSPAAAALASTVTGAISLPPSDPAGFRSFAFTAGPSLTAGDRFSIVLSATGADPLDSCYLRYGPVGDAYLGGDGWFVNDGQVSPFTPGGWLCLCDAGPGTSSDFPFRTLMETVGTPLPLPYVDVGITKTVSAEPVAPTEVFSYVLGVANTGTAVATAVTVTDDLPSGLAFMNAAGPCTYASPPQHRVTCTYPSLAVGANASITIVVRAPTVPTPPLLNVAQVQAPGDAKPQNNVAQATTTVVRPDVSVAKTDAPDPVATGAPLTYTIVVTNHGPTRATATLVDTLPAGVGFSSATGCSFTADPSGATGGKVTCDIGPMSVGAVVQRSIILNAPSFTTTITNTATVSAVEGDANTANDTATATTTVLAPPKMAITKQAAPDPALINAPVDYTITVFNTGGASGAGFVLVDVLPNDVAVTGLPANASCTHVPLSTGRGGTVTCSIASDPGPAGKSYVIKTTAATTGGTITNSATVTANFGGSSATATTTTTVIQPTMTVTQGCTQTVAPGDMYFCSVAVKNGSTIGFEATVSIAIPSGGALYEASWWAPKPCVVAGGAVSCTASLSPGQISGPSATFFAPVVKNASYSIPIGLFVNGIGGVVDTFQLTVTAPNLSVTKVADQGSAIPIAPTDPFRYTITVANSGPTGASFPAGDDIIVEDELPPGVTFVAAATSHSSSVCSYTVATHRVRCTFSSLSVGQQAQMYVDVRAPGVAGPILNKATVSSNWAMATASTTLTTQLTPPSLALTVTKSFAGGGATAHAPGDPVTYELSIKNNGPSYAGRGPLDDLVVTHDLAPGATFVDAQTSHSSAVCVYEQATHRARCSFQYLSPGDSASMNVWTVAPKVAGTFITTSTATSNGGTATASTSVTTQVTAPVLVVTKKAQIDVVGPGQYQSYEIAVENKGPSYASLSGAEHVIVSDALPAGMTFSSASTNWGVSVCTHAASTNTVSCTIPYIAPGETAYMYLQANAPSVVSPLVNTATATSNFGTATASATITTQMVNTAGGSNVSVSETDPATGSSVKLTFQYVSKAGDTTATSVPCPGQPPAGYTFQLGGRCYDLSTTATHSGDITVCITDASITTSSKLLHWDGYAPDPDDVTITPVTPPTICGTVWSLSPFAVIDPIRYRIHPLSDLARSITQGATVPVKLQLRDAAGMNVSSAEIAVRALGVDGGPAEDAGRSGPGGLFRFDDSLGPGGGYIFDLSTRDLAAGMHRLSFRAGEDPNVHEIEFNVR